MSANEPPRIAGPVVHPRRPRVMPPPGAWDTHAHIFGPSDKFPYQPNYIRGVGLDVFAAFRKTMVELGWVVQFFCDHRMLAETAAALRDIAREMTVIIDHFGMVPARGVSDPNFQALLKLVGDG